MSLRRFGMIGFAILSLLALTTPSFAYEEDTHFLLTYIICRSVGFTAPESLTVAAMDQGMDDSPDTEASPLRGSVTEVEWHALDLVGALGPKFIIKEKDRIFATALNQTSKQEKLKWLGIFFHFQQDTWAHRHHYDGDTHSYDNYTTYNTPFGHAMDGHKPDRPPYDPVTAMMDIEDGVKYAAIFLKQGLGRAPEFLFANYRAVGGTQDDNWTNSNKGKYFNQLAPAPATAGKASNYLTDLIRAQIEAYDMSAGTADKLDFDKARTAFQGVCDKYSMKITLPTEQEKLNQGFTTLLTDDLLKVYKNPLPVKQSIIVNNATVPAGQFRLGVQLELKYYLKDASGAEVQASAITPEIASGKSSTLDIPQGIEGPMEIQVWSLYSSNGVPSSKNYIYHLFFNSDFIGPIAFKCTGTTTVSCAVDTAVSGGPSIVGNDRKITLINGSVYRARMLITQDKKRIYTFWIDKRTSSTIPLPSGALNQSAPYLVEIVGEGVQKIIFTKSVPSNFTGDLTFKCSGTTSNPSGSQVP